MATYTELATIKDGTEWNGLLEKIRVACVIKAAAIIDSTTPAATALEWAKQAIAKPEQAGDFIAHYVIAANADASLVQIYGATDNAVQNNVGNAVDAIYGV